MEFEEGYLTYQEYKSLGGTLDIIPFNLIEFEARRKIDEKTYNRLHYTDKIPYEVKMCMNNLIGRIDKYASSINETSSNLASENIDGYSVSYVTTSQIQDIMKSKSIEIDDIIRTDLFGVIVNDEHILYSGVRKC